MKKKNYVSPTMEELRADEMHLLVGSGNNSAGAGGTGTSPGVTNDPFGAREDQFNEFE